MHKHLSARVVAAAVIFIIASFGVSFAHADTSLSWLTSTLSIQKQGDISLSPTLGGNGNIDCSMENTTLCSVPTSYGTATSNSSVRLNSSDEFLPVQTYIENRQRYFPVPNSSEALSYFSGPAYGSYLAFNYNFTSSAKLINNPLQGKWYQITNQPDGKLMDKSNHLLAADTSSISFSENGRWMVVSDPNVAILRVDMQTFDVLPFAPGLNYSLGLDPAVKTAITNDGRYAVVASKNFNVFKLYDLSTCTAVPDAINSAVSCQPRDLGSFMKQAVPGFSFVANARFMSDDTLALYAVYQSGGLNKTARFILSDSGIASQIDYLALGDSYISGEGAFDYIGGTDTGSNKCHVSFLSYPSLIGQDLSYNSYHNVACSGALTDDITNTRADYKGQADNKQISRSQRDAAGQTPLYLSSFMPGYIDQQDFVKTYQPKTITVSIGGNDMGFAEIVKNCAKSLGTCYNTYEDRLELVNLINGTVYPALTQTYNKLIAAGPPGMHIYAIGYPQIAKPGGDCGLNVHLNSDELFFSQELIDYLDTVIQTAAAQTGVYYVDTQDALDGHRLCEAKPGSIAMNGLTAGNDRPGKLGGPLGDESYHPNDFGYELLENKILSATRKLTNPMPASDPAAALPPESSLVILNVDKSGRPVNTTEFDPGLAPDLAFQQDQIAISINGSQNSLAANTVLQAEIHSTPIGLGTFTTDSNGNLNTSLVIPSTVPAGYHTLHFYGKDLAGQPIDIYKYIYIGASATDLDGDGISDSTQKCVGVSPSGQDFDKDGIDDSCDADITRPPAQQPISAYDAQTTPAAGTDNSRLISSQISGNTMDLNREINPISPGIDTSDVLTSALDTGSANKSLVLGTSTQKPSPATTSQESSNYPAINPALMIAGTVIMFTGAGLGVRRWVL